MTEDQQKTSDYPAVGASGAIGILANGYFAKKLSDLTLSGPRTVVAVVQPAAGSPAPDR